MAEGDFELAKELAAELGIDVPGQEQFPHLTDTGNAEWYAILFKDRLRYSWKLRSWFLWDGMRWDRDSGEQAAEWASKDVAHHYYEMSADLNRKAADFNVQAASEADSAQSQKMALKAVEASRLASTFTSWGRRIESRERRKAMIDLARGNPDIIIEPDQLDEHPNLLNTPAGTLELNTGNLREHRKEDYLTRLTGTSYIPGAQFDLWTQFVEQALPDPEVRRYVQKAAGRSLEGRPTADLIILQHGPGGTGKTTFQEALRKALGDYAISSTIETFASITNGYPHGPQPDVARLAGRRMVTIPEAETASDVVKMLKVVTGGDSIPTRSHRQETWEFTPSFVLWMRANRRPDLPRDDTGIWRRLREVPFLTRFPGDETVRERITSPEGLPAVLAWMVEGHRMYRDEGLGKIPEGIARATQEYQEEMDTMAVFWEDCIVEVPKAWTARPDTWKRYQEWARSSGVPRRQRLTRNAFYQKIEERLGNDRIVTRRGIRGFLGIGLLTSRSGLGPDDDPTLTDTQGAFFEGGATPRAPGNKIPVKPNAGEDSPGLNRDDDTLSVGNAPQGSFAPGDQPNEGESKEPPDPRYEGEV